MNKKIIALLQEKQKRLSERYYELEDLQGEFPHVYDAIQSEMQRIDDANECYRRAIYNLEAAARLEKEVRKCGEF